MWGKYNDISNKQMTKCKIHASLRCTPTLIDANLDIQGEDISIIIYNNTLMVQLFKPDEGHVKIVRFLKASGCEGQKHNSRLEVDIWLGHTRYGWWNSRGKEH